MRRGMLAMAVGLWGLVTGCGERAEQPVFRAGPPNWSTDVTARASASVGVLSGEVYEAINEAIDSRTGLPFGYAPISDGNAEVVVRQAGTHNTWQVSIASGSYRLAGLPLGVKLDVTANKFGLQPRTRSVTLASRGQGRLSFAYFGGTDDAYLLPQPTYQTPQP